MIYQFSFLNSVQPHSITTEKHIRSYRYLQDLWLSLTLRSTSKIIHFWVSFKVSYLEYQGPLVRKPSEFYLTCYLDCRSSPWFRTYNYHLWIRNGLSNQLLCWYHPYRYLYSLILRCANTNIDSDCSVVSASLNFDREHNSSWGLGHHVDSFAHGEVVAS